MRSLYLCLAFIVLCIPGAVEQYADYPSPKAASQTDELGVVDNAVSVLKDSSASSAQKLDALDKIHGAILFDRDSVLAKLQLLQAHRSSLIDLCHDEATDQLQILSADLVLWLDMNSGKRDQELVKLISTYDELKFLKLKILVDFLNIDASKDYQQILANRNTALTQSGEPKSRPPLKEDPTVFIGEFEYAVSRLDRSSDTTIKMIATFISERQPLDPKHTELLEEHRQDFASLLQSESVKTEVAIILMWMNMQAGTVDNELAKYFAGITQQRFEHAYRLANSLNLKDYETFQQVIAARRLSGYDDSDLLEDSFSAYGSDTFDGVLRDNMHLEGSRDLLFRSPLLTPRDSENWFKGHLSPDIRIDFKATVDVILNDAQTIQARKSSTATILWEIADLPNLEQHNLNVLINARERIVNLFRKLEGEAEFRGMLASLVICTNHLANAQYAQCQEAMKSLSPLELNLVMLYAPVLRMQSSNQFQQTVIDQFTNCDSDTAQIIIDVLERYADAGDLDFPIAFDLVAKLKDRPQISASQLKQLITMLVDLNAKEPGKMQPLEETKASASETEPKLDALELRRKEAELKVQEQEQRKEELERRSKARFR